MGFDDILECFFPSVYFDGLKVRRTPSCTGPHWAEFYECCYRYSSGCTAAAAPLDFLEFYVEYIRVVQ